MKKSQNTKIQTKRNQKNKHFVKSREDLKKLRVKQENRGFFKRKDRVFASII